jgi:hypothetical protein
MPSTIALLSFLLFALVAAWTVWRAARRLHTVGLLKDATVSRQWLVEHQTDDSGH